MTTVSQLERILSLIKTEIEVLDAMEKQLFLDTMGKEVLDDNALYNNNNNDLPSTTVQYEEFIETCINRTLVTIVVFQLLVSLKESQRNNGGRGTNNK